MTEVGAGAAIPHPGKHPSSVMAVQPAGVVSGIPTIGDACDALKKAGWRASIAGNPIAVNDESRAQFIGPAVGALGGVEGGWVIHRNAARERCRWSERVLNGVQDVATPIL